MENQEQPSWGGNQSRTGTQVIFVQRREHETERTWGAEAEHGGVVRNSGFIGSSLETTSQELSWMFLKTFMPPFSRVKTVCLLQWNSKQLSDITYSLTYSFPKFNPPTEVCFAHNPLLHQSFQCKLPAYSGPLDKFHSPDLRAWGFHIWPQTIYQLFLCPPTIPSLLFQASKSSDSFPFLCFSHFILPIKKTISALSL